ncbi:hypothetical protein QE368_003006 [Asaia bogorensis NBRC 16594]|nr:hypothetical protein [Asaia bogorensis NBRC 16594]
MGTDYSAVEHMLPVITQPQIYKGLKQSVSHALFSPTPEPDIHRVPLAVALMHIPPGAPSAQDMQHAIEKPAVVSGWSSPTPALRRQKRTNPRPFLIRQIASCHPCSLNLLFRRQEVNQISPRSYRPFVNVT